jgi:hypothetical protein
LLHELGGDIHQCNNEGCSSIFNAVYSALAMDNDKRYEQCIRFLHEHGVDINKRENRRWSALYFATVHSNAKCIKLLCELGADVNLVSNDGRSPLQVVVRSNRGIDNARILIQFGADMRMLDGLQIHHHGIRRLVDNVLAVLKSAANFVFTRSYGTSNEVNPDILRLDDAVILQRTLSLNVLETMDVSKLKQFMQLCTHITSAQPPPFNGQSDALMLAKLMNLFMCRDRVRDLHNMRILCKTAYRRSFPVPHRLDIELPTGVIESFLASDTSNLMVPFYYLHRALAIHNNNSAM